MEIRLDRIAKSFDKRRVIQPTTLTIRNGSFTTLLGPSGCGKTTLLRMIAGLETPDEGGIWLDDVCVFSGKQKINLPPEKRNLGFVFQDFALWPHMTVFENVLVAKHMRAKQNVFSATFRGNAKEEKRMRDETMALLVEQGLEKYKDDIATSLPYGIQRRLEIARALATDPKLLLLDEPAAGMNPQETLELAAFIHELRDKYGLTIFLIEHHMDLVMRISDYIYVIDFGSKIAEGIPQEIQNNQHVIDAYLGVVEDE